MTSLCLAYLIYPADDFKIQVPCGKLLKLYIEDYQVKIIKSEDKQDLWLHPFVVLHIAFVNRQYFDNIFTKGIVKWKAIKKRWFQYFLTCSLHEVKSKLRDVL